MEIKIVEIEVRGRNLHDHEYKRLGMPGYGGNVEWYSDGDNLKTPLMLTSSKEFIDLYSMIFGYFERAPSGERPSWEGDYQINDFTGGFELIRTGAPGNYDYGYTHHVGESADGSRLVAVPVAHKGEQVWRYRSGLYSSDEAPQNP